LSLAFAEPVIRSVGPPPARHADRVVSEMLRVISERRARILPMIRQTWFEGRDGNPSAQLKLAERLERAGAIGARVMEPGKRGRFYMQLHDMSGWNPARNAPIDPGDAIPDTPQLAYWITNIEGLGRGQYNIRSKPFLIITHHALSRFAQRCGGRDVDDMFDCVNAVWRTAAMLLRSLDDDLDRWLAPPSAGWRVKLDDGTIAVLGRHESMRSLVLKTVWANGQLEAA
jgi:hypothetical protein